MNLTWKEPPPSGRSGGEARYEAEAAAMRANPGRWLLLDTFLSSEGSNARSTGYSIKIGRYAALRPAGAFEVRTASEETAAGPRISLYARYTGTGEA